MFALCLTGLMLFLVYNSMFAVANNGVPESISESAYFFHPAAFTLICFVSAICIWPLWTSLTPDEYQFCVFLSCAGTLLAGCSPYFKAERVQSIIHYTSGTISIAFAALWLVLTHNYTPLAWIAGTGIVWTIFQPTRYTFIFENVSYSGICITLLHTAINL